MQNAYGLLTEICLCLEKTNTISSLHRHFSDPRMKYSHSVLPKLQSAQSTLNNEQKGKTPARDRETGVF